MNKLKTKIILSISLVFAFALMLAGTLFIKPQTKTAYASNETEQTYTISGSNLNKFYSYRDRTENEIIDCNKVFGGISVHYSGGNDNMLSGLYNSDNGNKNLLFNRNTSILTFTSDTPVKNVRFLFNKEQDCDGAIDVNHGRWTNETYLAAYNGYYVGTNWIEYKIYALELNGPASKTIALQSLCI